MDDFMSEIVERVRRETALEQAVEFAKKMIALGKLTLEEISNICELPLEKVQELAANISAETKGQI